MTEPLETHEPRAVQPGLVEQLIDHATLLTHGGTNASRLAHDLRLAASWLNHYRDALRSIANNSCCDRCQEAAIVARAALAKGPDVVPPKNAARPETVPVERDS